MIPIHDNIPPRTVPYVNYGIIGTCVLVFLLQLVSGDDQLIQRLGMIPVRVLHPDRKIEIVQEIPVRTPFGIRHLLKREQVAPAAVPAVATLLTCIFFARGMAAHHRQSLVSAHIWR